MVLLQGSSHSRLKFVFLDRGCGGRGRAALFETLAPSLGVRGWNVPELNVRRNCFEPIGSGNPFVLELA